jgi:hypothetical protein
VNTSKILVAVLLFVVAQVPGWSQDQAKEKNFPEDKPKEKIGKKKKPKKKQAPEQHFPEDKPQKPPAPTPKG